MVAYSTIVTGTDGSDSSMHAVATAASLARVYQARLIIVCAYYTKTGSLLDAKADANALPVITRESSELALDEAREVAAEEGAEEIELVAHKGAPAGALTDTVKRENADLIVIGNKGIKSLTGRVIGSIPTEVTRRSSADVMVVNSDDLDT